MRNKSYKFFYITGAVAIILAITLVILYRVYNKKLDDISKSMLSTEQIIGLVPNTTEDKEGETESASSDLSKSIEQVQENMNNTIENTNTVNATTTEEKETTTVIDKEEEQKPEPKKELVFAYPVEGEISREFSVENLIYSEINL